MPFFKFKRFIFLFSLLFLQTQFLKAQEFGVREDIQSMTESTPEPSLSSLQEIETYFNTPGFGGDSSTLLEDQIIQLFQQADESTKINVSLYTFSRVPVAMAMLEAQARGASIELVMDDKNLDQVKKVGAALNILVNGAQGLPGLKCGKKSCITFCKGSCTGLWINHNKFFLFSKLKQSLKVSGQNKISEYIVAQTSANLTEGQLKNYNDLVVIKNDKPFYDGMMNYWKKLKKDSFNLKKTETLDGQKGLKSYFFPRLLGSDPVQKILEQVRCDLPGSKIRVIQSRFDDGRSYLAKLLADLSDQGCDLKVIVRDEPDQDSPGRQVVSHLGRNLAILPYKGKDGEIKANNSIHSKVILINARMDGMKKKETLVLTGSHNLNTTSLRTNDETLFKINDLKTFNSYLNYWNRLSEESKAF